MPKHFIFLLILGVIFSSGCSSSIKQTNPISTTVSPALLEDGSPPIVQFTPLPPISEVLSQMVAPQWNTLWLLGERVDIQKNEIIYLNGWLSRDGYGTLLLSKPLNRRVDGEQINLVPLENQFLTNGKQISSITDPQPRQISENWKIHPFELIEPFFASLFTLEIDVEENWQIIGKSQMAGNEVIVLQNDRYRLWIDQQRGVVLRLEIFDMPEKQQPVRILQIKGIAFDIPIPARSRQIVLHEGYSPGMGERPAGNVDSLRGKPLEFHYLTRDIANPSKGYWVDVYSPFGFLGTLDIGSAGFYCGRSADGNWFAYLYQLPGSVKTELRWVDLRQIEQVYSVRDIQNPSAPVWSPNGYSIAFTGFREGEKERSTFVVEISSAEILKLGSGSLLPPAWSEDGKYIYSLDEGYQYLLAFDLSGNLTGKWRFDPENWRVIESNAPFNTVQLDQKFSRRGFDYLNLCRLP